MATVKFKIKTDTGGHTFPSNDIFLTTSSSYRIISSIIIDNLTRLKILELEFDRFLTNEVMYTNAVEKIKTETPFKMMPNDKLDYDKGILRVTDFGKNFIDICLS